jgi:prevent-host-death family protein
LAVDIPVSEAKAQLTDLVRRAEAGEDIVLTRHGQPVVRFSPVKRLAPTAAEKLALFESIIASGRAKVGPEEDAARSQDWLYDDDGLPV